MITAGPVQLCAALLCAAGLIDGNSVTQTPLLWKGETQSATMSCSHTLASSYFQMYWYRQRERLEEIVFTTPTPPHKYASGFDEAKFPVKKSDYQNGSLTVEKLRPEDSGVYFCAVSQHSDSGEWDGCTNTQMLLLLPQ